MKTLIKRIALPVMAILLSTGLSSFSKPAGGDVFEVYIGKTLMIQQAVHNDKSTRNITLEPSHYNEKLSIRFFHCGTTGKKRVITLKDANNRVLKQFNFTEAKSGNEAMVCNIKDIIDLQNSGSSTIRLYYSSAELPGGRCLVSLLKTGSGS